MSSKILQIQSKGIYHGLPVFDNGIRGLTAIVCGANGISGQYMMRVLAESPQRWKKIYCLSRRPPLIPGGLPAHAEHIPCDFLQEPKAIADVLKSNNVQADYVFFFAYVQVEAKDNERLWSDAEGMTRVNKALLENFLGALPLANIKPRRIMLQTGAKNYGLHLGPTKVPQEESDNVRKLATLEPNFYYAQEDVLFDYCKANGVSWNVAMPSHIIGAVPDAAMNGAFAWAFYATVCKYMKQPMVFPSDITAWQNTQVCSTAKMNAYLEEWSVLNPETADQRFNASDAHDFSWEIAWPAVASWYGLEWQGPAESSKDYVEVSTPYEPPPRGYGPREVIRVRHRYVDWAKKPEVQAAWKELTAKFHLTEFDFTKSNQVFGFLDTMFVLPYRLHLSTSKARKFGFHGYVDTLESLHATFQEFVELKMIPPISSV